jgi:hypothetical protein
MGDLGVQFYREPGRTVAELPETVKQRFDQSCDLPSM